MQENCSKIPSGFINKDGFLEEMNQTKLFGYALITVSLLLLVVLGVVKQNTDKQALVLCQMFHEQNLNMEGCPAHKSNTSWMIITAFGIAFLVLALGIVCLFLRPASRPPEEQPKEQSTREFKPLDETKLDAEEKVMYGLIKAKEGSAYQGDLVRESGFGKVKVTRILDKLENMGVLERKRRGMTNIIVLK